jgi:CRP/FNR family transcriptional regulator, cyclic AMP receptor protein
MPVVGLFRNATETMKFPAGSTVFNEGESGSEMYGVVEGEVELRTADRVIGTVGPDGVFGEMAIVDRSPRMATAVATRDSVLAVIDRRRFLFLVHETPTFALEVMSDMADRLRAYAQAKRSD